MMRRNKTILVTGSGTGIGQAIARKFAKEGHNIIILGRREGPLIEASNILKDIILREGHNSSVTYYPGVDVADENALDMMFEDIKSKSSGIDIIVNNAGVSGPVKIFTNSEYSDFKDCVSIHLTGTFWTSMKGLNLINEDGKIITISTFFTEENKFDQRPYRFRTPYTASQGAKNRLSEALAWELADRNIKSIATNPGPVHSDRIYKTVYPKAAAEFLRIGGFEGLTHKQVEEISTKLLPYLGDDKQTIENEALKIAKFHCKDQDEFNINSFKDKCLSLLSKIQEIAEKVQNNTKKMIVDNEFLKQEDVAEMVYNLSSDILSGLVNGRVIPNDRVFYPVKPIVNKQLINQNIKSLKNKVILITTSSDSIEYLQTIQHIASKLNSTGLKQLVVLTHRNSKINDSKSIFKSFHHHEINLADEESVKKIFNTIETHFGQIDASIHFTGTYDYNKKLTSLNRKEWNEMVEKFIYIPHLVTRYSVLSFASLEAMEDPRRFKSAFGNIVIVGPDSPVGKKIDGEVRARSELFRGALRPYITTANQELHDVLDSKINLTLIFRGSISGDVPNYERLEQSILAIVSQQELGCDIINYIDE